MVELSISHFFARIFFVSIYFLNSFHNGELLMQFSTMTVRLDLGTTGKACLKSTRRKILQPKGQSQLVISRSMTSIAHKAWTGTIDDSSIMNILMEHRNAAWVDVGEIWQTLVSVIGTVIWRGCGTFYHHPEGLQRSKSMRLAQLGAQEIESTKSVCYIP